jgi:four helix bundle protein
MGKAAKTFEELVMYQRARDLVNAIYAATRDGSFTKDYGLKDQIRRAGISILSNIAEGFDRGSTVEFVQFLYIAKGSCAEVRAQLQIALDQRYMTSAEYQRLAELAQWISGMISNFIKHLQSTPYKGKKFIQVKSIEKVTK